MYWIKRKMYRRMIVVLALMIGVSFALTCCGSSDAEAQKENTGKEEAPKEPEKTKPSGNLEMRDDSGNVYITIADIDSVEAETVEHDGKTEYCVSIIFTEEGKEKFADATGKMIGEQMGIYVDGELVSNPTIMSAITDGKAQITGMDSFEEAENLAMVIRGDAAEQLAEKKEESEAGLGNFEESADVVKQISMGLHHSAAVMQNGDLYTWGENKWGQLGNGTTADSQTPVKVMENVAWVSLGTVHSAAIMQNGDLYMWGDNDGGSLGNGTTEDSLTPVKVMENVAQVSLGGSHSAAVTQDGDLYLWGSNESGRLGNGTTENSLTPVKVMENVVQVSLGWEHSAAITQDGDLYLWGSNELGQLGNGTTENSLTPVKIMENVAQVGLGSEHSAAITKDGDLYQWGKKFEPEYVTTILAPEKVMGNVAQVSLGWEHSAAVTREDELYLWGWNEHGQLGDGTAENSSTPKKIMEGVAQVSSGNAHNMIVTQEGDLFLWGSNRFGQLGDGTTEDRPTPIKITIPPEDGSKDE